MTHTFLRRPKLRSDSVISTKASELTLRQSLYPLALVTFLFFLWGLSSGLLDTLNKHFQDTLGITRGRAAGLQAAYYIAYPIASLGHANYILRHYGYKPVFIWGLCLYGVGALLAWPCVVYRSFGGFCTATFIVGNGLGALEAAANPYITVCGPPKHSELRINLSQAFNGIGIVIAPVLGSYVFFQVDDNKQGLRNVQWVYLAIAVFVFALAAIVLFSPFPEISDADMASQTTRTTTSTHPNAKPRPFHTQYRLFHAAFAQFCYTGAQVAITSYFINYVTETRPNTSSSTGSKFLAGAQGGFTLGRFIGSFAMKYVRPRIVFFAFLTCCVVCIAPSITQRGDVGVSMLYLTMFFESVCFPTIVALGLRGLGEHTKRGSGFIVGGVAGGAVVPPLLGAVADRTNSTATAMSVPLAFLVAAWTYPVCVNLVACYRTPADQVDDDDMNMGVGVGADDTDVERGDSSSDHEHEWDSPRRGTVLSDKTLVDADVEDRGRHRLTKPDKVLLGPKLTVVEMTDD